MTKLSIFFFCVLGLWATRANADPSSRPPQRDTLEAGAGMLLLPRDGEEPWVFPQVSTEVAMNVTGMIARTRLEQVFENLSEQLVDAVYVFPLPDTAAVDGLLLRVGERTIKGEIVEREDAERRFEHAARAGKVASLVAQQRPNLFTTRVANVAPGELVRVQISYQEDVRYDRGVFSVMFPSTLTPRYNPGSPEPGKAKSGLGFGANTSRVPDADQITPHMLVDGSGPLFDVRVALDAGVPLERIESSSHLLDVQHSPGKAVGIRLKEGPVLADRDFRLEWQPKLGTAPTSALLTEDFAGERYALLMLLPPEVAPDPAMRLARETLFVIDTSGSMAGSSIAQALASLRIGLEALRPKDHFNVIEFDSTARQLFEGPRPASRPNIDEALAWLDSLDADGGTEMLSALTLAMGTAPHPERVRQLVFITDGSVGNEDELFRFIKDQLGDQRMFTVGIGSAPNRHFMRGAARFGRGTFTEVSSLTEVSTKMNALWSKLDAPVLHDLRLSWHGGLAPEAWPARSPDLYQGEPLMILAKLSPETRGVTVAGRRAGQTFKEQVNVVRGVTERGIHRLWARRKIEALMDSSLDGGDPTSLRAKVVPIALKHHLVSKFTSLVAIDSVATAAGPSVRREVGLALPAGSEMFGNMPQTATPGPICLLLGALSLAAASIVQRRVGS